MEKLFGIDTNILAVALFCVMVFIFISASLLALRNKVFLKLALRNIPRRKAQTLLIIVGLMLSTTIIMAALAIGDSINSGIRLQALYSLGDTDIRLSSPMSSRFGDDYFGEHVVDQVRSQIESDERVDGILPLVREQMPIVNESSNKTLASAAVIGVDLDSLDGFDYLIGTEEKGRTKVDLRAIHDGEIIINQPMADELDVGIGGYITLIAPTGHSKHKVLDIVDPVGILGGTQSSRSSALFPDKTLQRAMGRQGYNIIEISIKGDEVVKYVTHDEKISEDVTKKLKLGFINHAASESLLEVLKTPVINNALKAKLADKKTNGNRTSSDNPIYALMVGLNEETPSDDFKIAAINDEVQAVIFEILENLDDPVVSRTVLMSISELVELKVDPIKNRSLKFAELISSGIVVFFTIFGSFSIIVGLLLIFLVFVMLAASRTTEMGIARAIGTKRRHLVQMFTYEGLIYSIGASVFGTGLGLLASVLLIQIMIRGFADDDSVRFHYSVTLQSIVIAFSSGFVLTAITVMISAYRVSKLNIVVAIRGLNQEFAVDNVANSRDRMKVVVKWVFGPLTFAYETWRLWRSGHGIILRIVMFLFLLFIVPWIIILAIKLFKLFQPWLAFGWPLLPIGLIIAFSSLDPDKGVENFAYDNAALLAIGVTLSIIAIGLMIKGFLLYRGYRDEIQKRVSMTLIGIAILIFYSLPFDALEDITGELEGGPEMFILSGVSLVAAAVWVIMHNADVLVWIVSKIMGPWGSMRPVVKLAIAYPMSARLRTGLTLAMFSLVIFTMMIFAILINLGNVISDDPDRASGGFDIRGSIKQELPIKDPYKILDSTDNNLSRSDFKLITAQARLRAEVRQDDTEKPIFQRVRIRASDNAWLTNNGYELTHWDPKYGETSEEIWQSVTKDHSLAIVSAGIIRPDDGWGPPRLDSDFRINGIKSDEKGEIEAVSITLRPPIVQGNPDRVVKRKVIGVLDEFADNFENNDNDIYMHHTILAELSDKTIPFTDYKFKLEDSSRALDITRLLETAFIEHGMTAISIREEINKDQAQTNAFNQLFQGFMGLGLLVGVAALGVGAFRAVVERRQSIGMMRAIGYKSSHVQLQFLMESAIVAVMGSALGVGLGTLIAWNIFKSISEESGGLTFSVPFVNVTLIVLIAVVFSLFNTLLPARQASKITPSEALRYE